MITSEKQWEDMFIGPLIKHARLVEKGVGNRTALEMVYSKEEADAVYNIIAAATNEKKTINQNNN